MKRIVLILVAIAATLCIVTTAQGRKWPSPPSWFVKDMHCIGFYESHNGADPSAGGNLYGMLQGWAQVGGYGFAGNASPEEQMYRTWLLYNWAIRNKGYSARWTPWDNPGVNYGYCHLVN